jgi:hypothetical protein
MNIKEALTDLLSFHIHNGINLSSVIGFCGLEINELELFSYKISYYCSDNADELHTKSYIFNVLFVKLIFILHNQLKPKYLCDII